MRVSGRGRLAGVGRQEELDPLRAVRARAWRRPPPGPSPSGEQRHLQAAAGHGQPGELPLRPPRAEGPGRLAPGPREQPGQGGRLGAGRVDLGRAAPPAARRRRSASGARPPSPSAAPPPPRACRRACAPGPASASSRSSSWPSRSRIAAHRVGVAGERAPGLVELDGRRAEELERRRQPAVERRRVAEGAHRLPHLLGWRCRPRRRPAPRAERAASRSFSALASTRRSPSRAASSPGLGSMASSSLELEGEVVGPAGRAPRRRGCRSSRSRQSRASRLEGGPVAGEERRRGRAAAAPPGRASARPPAPAKASRSARWVPSSRSETCSCWPGDVDHAAQRLGQHRGGDQRAVDVGPPAPAARGHAPHQELDRLARRRRAPPRPPSSRAKTGWSAGSSKSASTTASSAPSRSTSALMRPPRTRWRALTRIDLPAPVSPVRTFSPGPKRTSTESTMAKPETLQGREHGRSCHRPLTLRKFSVVGVFRSWRRRPREGPDRAAQGLTRAERAAPGSRSVLAVPRPLPCFPWPWSSPSFPCGP